MNAESIKRWLTRKRKKRLIWAGSLLCLYAITGFLVLPWILGRVLPKQASKLLLREVTVEKIRINPFALSGSLQGVEVKDKEGEDLLSWREVYANFQLSSIFRWAWTFREVRVVEPYVHLEILPDYSLNIADIIEEYSGGEEGESSEEASVPPLRVERLFITNAVAEFTDRTLREPFHYQAGPVDFELRKFYTHPDNSNPYSLQGSTATGEQFAWQGRFYLFPLRSQGQLSVENVRLQTFAPFYQDFLSLTIEDGVIRAGSAYDLEYSATNQHLAVSNAGFELNSLVVQDDALGSGHAVELDHLKVSGVEADLFSRRGRVGQVQVQGGRLFVRRAKDAEINVISMAAPSNTNAEPAGAVLMAMSAMTNLIHTFLGTTNQAVARVDRLDVRDCSLRLEDDVNTRPVRLLIDEVNVVATNLSNLPGEPLFLDLSARWNTNGTAKVDVNAKLFPAHADVTIQLDRIEVHPLDPYAEPFASVLLLDTELNLDGLLKVRRETTNAPFDVLFSGDIALNNLSTVEAVEGSDLLSWKRVALSGIEAVLHPPVVSVQKVLVEDARATVVVESNRTINVLNAARIGDTNEPVKVPEFSLNRSTAGLSETPGAPGATAESESPPFELLKVDLPLLILSNAQLQVRDLSCQPSLHWMVTEVNGEIRGLSTDGQQNGELNLTAKAGGTALVSIGGQLNPFDLDKPADIKVNLDGMDLAPFDPYSGRYAGYRLRKGKLSLDLTYHIVERRLKSENLITVDQLTLGQKVDSPDATKLPVKLGVAILKDRNGVIELDVPVEGDLNDPEFRLSRVIGHTIMVTLTKVMTSPFGLLGSLVGGSPEELSSFEFDSGSAVIEPSQTNGLQKLCKALYERPGLEVEIEGSVDLEKDGRVIRRVKLNRQIQQARWADLRESARADTRPEDLDVPPDVRRTYLKKLFLEAHPDEARSLAFKPGEEAQMYERLVDRLIEQIGVKPEEYRVLATARARAIQQYLLEKGGVDAGRLFLVDASETVKQEGCRALLQLQ